MKGLVEWLEGKKTYIVAILGALYNVGIAFAWWTPDDQYVILINSVLAALGVGFLRAGVTKSK